MNYFFGWSSSLTKLRTQDCYKQLSWGLQALPKVETTLAKQPTHHSFLYCRFAILIPKLNFSQLAGYL
ncbi:hypothetical protein ACFX13_022702 [Malus domestica]